jgi:hypothetical protein
VPLADDRKKQLSRNEIQTASNSMSATIVSSRLQIHAGKTDGQIDAIEAPEFTPEDKIDFDRLDFPCSGRTNRAGRVIVRGENTYGTSEW